MGNVIETVELPDTPPDLAFFSLTFAGLDGLVLVNASDQVISTITASVTKHWKTGIRESSHGRSFHTIDLNKRLLQSIKADALRRRYLCCELLADLRGAGWKLAGCADLSLTADFTTWFFQRAAMTLPAPMSALSSPIIGVSLSAEDRMHIINADPNVVVTLNQALREKVQGGRYFRDMKDMRELPYEIQFEHDLWWLEGELAEKRAMIAREVILRVFKHLDIAGYQFVGSCNVKGHSADCIFFQQISSTDSSSAVNEYSLVTMTGVNGVLLTHVSSIVCDDVAKVIAKHWPAGLASRKDLEYVNEYNNGHEFILNGKPWKCQNEEQASAKQVIAGVLEVMQSHGWVVTCALDISRNFDDKSVFIFTSSPPVPRSRKGYIALAPDRHNQLWLINASSEVEKKMEELVEDLWTHGLVKKRVDRGNVCWKLGGLPWHHENSTDWIVARHLLSCALHELSLLGWVLACCADLSADYEVDPTTGEPRRTLDVHTLFFRQNRALPANL